MTDVAAPPVPPPPPASTPAIPPPKEGKGCLFYGCLTVVILVLVIVLTATITAWRVRKSLDAKPITPTELSAEEQDELDEKLAEFRRGAEGGDSEAELNPAEIARGEQTLEENDRTQDADFERKPLVITEKEINALIANNTDLGDKVYITLDNNAMKFKVNYPVEEGTPFLGGKTVRINVRTKFLLEGDQLDIRITDVSLGGIPVPNSWLQGIKNVNLVEEYGVDIDGSSALADGIEEFSIDDGQLTLLPAE